MRFTQRFVALLGAFALLAVGSPAEVAGAATTAAERRTSAWLPYWDTRGLQTVVDNADIFDELLLFWYEMDSRGTVRASDPNNPEEARILDAAARANVPVFATVSNHFDPVPVHTMLATDASIDSHVAALLDIADSYAGLDIDYEGLYASDRSRFTRFINRLAAALHAKDQRLSVTVHPKTSEPGTWNGPQAQDWAAIAAVADRVRIMAYDYHWASSSAGAIAPVSWVESVVAFAVTQIPRSKVDLGMPLYGYDWLGTSGDGILWERAEQRRINAGASLNRSADGEPWFSYQTSNGQRTVWYSDALSTTPKLEVVNRYGLRGHTFWRLGGEDPAVWDSVREWAFAPPAPPQEPVSELAAEGKPERILVTWQQPIDKTAIRYRVLRSTSKTGKRTRIAATADLRFRDNRVKQGRKYWYVVRPLNAQGIAGPVSKRVVARPA